MARIGKIVTFDGSRETISDALVRGITALNLTSGINWSFVNNTTMNIYGDSAELTQLKTAANNKGYTFDIIGDAPAEPIDTPLPTPTQDELNSMAFMNTAWQNMKASEKARLLAILETEYNAINNTPITFTNAIKPDISRWLR